MKKRDEHSEKRDERILELAESIWLPGISGDCKEVFEARSRTIRDHFRSELRVHVLAVGSRRDIFVMPDKERYSVRGEAFDRYALASKAVLDMLHMGNALHLSGDEDTPGTWAAKLERMQQIADNALLDWLEAGFPDSPKYPRWKLD